MPRLNITKLGLLSDAWRVDLHSPGFETWKDAFEEDSRRSRRLRKWAVRRRGRRAAQANELADLLDPKVTPGVPDTPASARYLRDHRIRIISAVWKLVAGDETGKAARFDAIKPAWACKSSRLRKETAIRLRGEFRADLLRAAAKVIPGGAGNCEGFLFAVLHGDYEEVEKLIQPHFHIVATGDWVAVVDRLRHMAAYQPTDRVKRPIRARRKLQDLAYALTYLLKTYWPGKWCGHVSGKFGKRRSRKHGRIPEPIHSKVILWLSEQNLQDMILMMKLEVQKCGLVIKLNPYTNNIIEESLSPDIAK